MVRDCNSLQICGFQRYRTAFVTSTGRFLRTVFDIDDSDEKGKVDCGIVDDDYVVLTALRME